MPLLFRERSDNAKLQSSCFNLRMNRMLEVGLRGEMRMTVSPEHSAKLVHPKRPDVLGTMPLIGLIERTAAKVVDAYLEPGLITVGTAVNVTHSAPVPMWMEVACRVRLVKIDGRRIVFDVEILDEEGIISEGTYQKHIIDIRTFEEKIKEKEQRQIKRLRAEQD